MSSANSWVQKARENKAFSEKRKAAKEAGLPPPPLPFASSSSAAANVNRNPGSGLVGSPSAA